MGVEVIQLLKYLKGKGGSDLHLTSGLEPRIRLHGHLEAVEGWSAIDDGLMRQLLRPITTDVQWAEFQKTGDLDFAYGVDGLARYRANFFVQEKGAGAVFRMIPERITPLGELRLPPVVETLAHLEKGLVLVTGPTGAGKSTTLAAIIDKI